jgi:hypothetical protein
MPRAHINIDAWKDQVKQWLDEGLGYDEIRRNLWKEGGIQISEKTFGKRLREWGIYVKQPYLSNDMTALRKRITEIFNEGRLTDPEAVQTLKNEGFNVRAKTYQNMRREMGLYKRSHAGFRPLATENTTTSEAG